MARRRGFCRFPPLPPYDSLSDVQRDRLAELFLPYLYLVGYMEPPSYRGGYMTVAYTMVDGDCATVYVRRAHPLETRMIHDAVTRRAFIRAGATPQYTPSQ